MVQPGIYTILNVKGGTALDLSGGDSRSIIGFDLHGQGNQQWSIQQKDCGYTIRGVSTGKYLSHEGGGNLRDAIKVVADDDEKIWEIYKDEHNHGAFRIQVPGTPFNLDLSNHGDNTPGTPVELWGKWQGANQTWIFNKIG